MNDHGANQIQRDVNAADSGTNGASRRTQPGAPARDHGEEGSLLPPPQPQAVGKNALRDATAARFLPVVDYNAMHDSVKKKRVLKQIQVSCDLFMLISPLAKL